MLRVGNLQRSIDFYTQVMGMQLLKTSENPAHKYSLAFLGYGSNPEHAELELTYNWGTESYEMGSAYGWARCRGQHCDRFCDRPRWLQSRVDSTHFLIGAGSPFKKFTA